MFKSSQVDLDKQVHVACVSHLRQRMVEPLELLASNLRLELQVLAREVAQSLILLGQCEAIDESIGRQLLFRDQRQG